MKTALKEIEMDFDYSVNMMEEAEMNYRSDPCEDNFEMLKMWQDVVYDLMEELER